MREQLHLPGSNSFQFRNERKGRGTGDAFLTLNDTAHGTPGKYTLNHMSPYSQVQNPFFPPF